MTRGKKLIVLLVVLVLIAAAAVLAVTLSNKSTEKAEAEKAQEIADATMTVFTSDANSITHVSWVYPDSSFSFTKSGDGWINDDDSQFPVSADGVMKLLSALNSVTSMKCIEKPENLQQFGITEPQMVITIDDGSQRSLIIGNETGLGGQYYLSNGDGNVYVIDSSLPNSCSASLSNVIELEKIQPMTDLISFTISRSDSEDLTIMRDGDVWSAAEDGDNVTLNAEKAHDFYKNLRDIRWSSVVTWKADEDYLAGIGLDTPGCIVAAQCKDSDGKVFHQVFEIGDVFAEDSAYYYCRLAGSSMVYLIEAETAEAFMCADITSLM